ncbi:DUF4240 domain-containing protein [Bacillus sp. FSL W7-1360]
MNMQTFWKLIEQSKTKPKYDGLGSETRTKWLENELLNRGLEDAVYAEAAIVKLRSKMFSNDTLSRIIRDEAVGKRDLHFSDDILGDIISGIILEGENVFMSSLKNPNYLRNYLAKAVTIPREDDLFMAAIRAADRLSENEQTTHKIRLIAKEQISQEISKTKETTAVLEDLTPEKQQELAEMYYTWTEMIDSLAWLESTTKDIPYKREEIKELKEGKDHLKKIILEWGFNLNPTKGLQDSKGTISVLTRQDPNNPHELSFILQRDN